MFKTISLIIAVFLINASIYAQKSPVCGVNFIPGASGVLTINGTQKFNVRINAARKIYLPEGRHYLMFEALSPCEFFKDEILTVNKKDLGGTIAHHISFITEIFETQLFRALEFNQTDEFKRLVNCGIEVNKKNKDGITLLHTAANRGNIEACKILISKGADVNAKATLDSATPLHDAAFSGKKDVVRLLIDKGADINARTTPFKTTPFKVAQDFNNRKVEELLKYFGGTL